MARAALKWSAKELGERCGLAMKTIQRIESVEGVPASFQSTLAEIVATLEAAGIEFIGTPDDGPGIRLHKSKK